MTQKVRAVALTQPLIEECETAEDFVAYAARVSNPNNQANKKTAPKLLKYLKEHAHWSPFEMVHVTMEIETTRDIARQILRHRSFAFQEFSQRYADVTLMEDTFVTRECRLQDTKNRQNSVSEGVPDTFKTWWEEAQKGILETVQLYYQTALDNGVAKEQARAILPEGLTRSRLYMAGSLRSWIHYCDLRKANGTQKEHMEIAQMCWDELLKHFSNLKEDTKDDT